MKVAIIDFETTGVDPSKSQVIEVGACLFDADNAAIVACFSGLARSESNAAEHVNRISPALLVEAQPLNDEWWGPVEAIFDIADAVTAWCSDFDRGFTPPRLAAMRPWFDAADCEWPRAGSSRSLADAVARHGVPMGIAHRALADVLAVAALFQRADELHRLGESKWSLRQMIDRALAPRALVVGIWGYDPPTNERAKAAGFSFDGQKKRWTKKVIAEEVHAFVEGLTFPVVVNDLPKEGRETR